MSDILHTFCQICLPGFKTRFHYSLSGLKLRILTQPPKHRHVCATTPCSLPIFLFLLLTVCVGIGMFTYLEGQKRVSDPLIPSSWIKMAAVSHSLCVLETHFWCSPRTSKYFEPQVHLLSLSLTLFHFFRCSTVFLLWSLLKSQVFSFP